MSKVYFYAPKKNTHQFFEKEQLKWHDIVEARKKVSGNFTSWILTTYINLKRRGLSCEVVEQMPEAGIVIADRDTLGNKYSYLDKVMLICAKGDREFHPSAQLHVVHNPCEFDLTKNSLWKPYYIPHWPQPGLIPRLKERGSLAENVAFIGTRSNLVQEFLSEKWINSLKDLNCKWHPIWNPIRWNDYSYIDIVIAVRSFSQTAWLNKPTSKLVNCWLAGVPVILTPESAFTALRKSELDFCEITSLDEAIETVAKLKNNSQLYQSMVNNGFIRVQEYTQEKIVEHWLSFFYEHIFLEYEKFIKMPKIKRRFLFMRRYTQLKKDRMKTRFKIIRN